MKKKLMSMVSLILIFSLIGTASVFANTQNQGKGKNNKVGDTETSVTEDVYGDKGKDKNKNAGKGLLIALENVKGLPSESIILDLIEKKGIVIEEVAQGLQELAEGLEDEETLEATDEELKDYTDALRNYMKELKVKPKDQKAILSQMAEIYETLGSVDEAIEVLEEVLKEDFKEINSYKKLGLLYGKKGENEIRAYVNGEKPNSDIAPIVRDGRTLIPFRAIAQSLKAEVIWNAEEQSVTVIKDGVEVKLIIGSTTAYVNGNEVTLDAAPDIISGRTVVPARFIAEAFGAIVKWESESQSVIIYEEVEAEASTEE
jgi:tetratricopeptide (TPR) repeat protein